MANKIEHRSFKGLSLVIETDSNYINATALAKRYKERTGKYKQPADWLKTKRTQQTIDYVAEVNDLSPEDLVRTVQGGKIPDEQGTFLHQDLAIPFASWLSVEFEYAVTKIILKEMSGENRRKLDEVMQLLKSIETYLMEGDGINKKIHTAAHQQSEKLTSGIKLVRDKLIQLTEGE